VNKLLLVLFDFNPHLAMYDVHLGVVVACNDMPTSHPLRNVPFFTCKDFFLSPFVSSILPSYVEAQPKVLTNFQSLYPSFKDTSIDSRILAFIDKFA
jgi:hypothetical protein